MHACEAGCGAAAVRECIADSRTDHAPATNPEGGDTENKPSTSGTANSAELGLKGCGHIRKSGVYQLNSHIGENRVPRHMRFHVQQEQQEW